MSTSAELITWISAPTISTSFDSRDLVKGKLMCIVLCPNVVQITAFLLHDPLSRYPAKSFWMKLMDTRTDYKLHFRRFVFFLQIIWKSLFSAIWGKIYAFECVAALLSF